MPKMIGLGLSRREREILDVLHAKERASANEVMEGMPHPPSYSAVRSILRILETKGYVWHEGEGKKYIYLPTEPQQSAARSALKQVMQTFFGGSIERTVQTFLSDAESDVSDEELERLTAIIREAKHAEGGEECSHTI